MRKAWEGYAAYLKAAGAYGSRVEEVKTVLKGMESDVAQQGPPKPQATGSFLSIEGCGPGGLRRRAWPLR